MKILSNNPHFTQHTNTKTQAQCNHSDSFAGMIAFVASEMLNHAPTPTESQSNKRCRAVSAFETGRGGARRGSRDHGRGRLRGNGFGRGRSLSDSSHASSAIANGVNMSNPTRQFTDQEMERQGPEGRRMMHVMRDRSNDGCRGRQGGRGRDQQSAHRQGRMTAAVQQDDDQTQEEASQIAESTLQMVQEHLTRGGRGGCAGNRFGQGWHVAAARAILRTSSKRTTKAKAVDMRDITNLPIKMKMLSRNKMDAMANASCAGSNWTPICFTGDTVDVLPFSPECCQSLKDMPMATCATIMMMQTGKQWLVVAHKMLHFGKLMDRSLVDPN